MAYQKVKGTLDFYGLDSYKVRYVEAKARELMKHCGFEEIITPIFENTDVFVRSSGDSSDVVTKEMYSFFDKGGRNITLRPEGTAGAVRCFLENKLYVDNPIKKFFYFGPMFRYDRPQAGRYRQFNQFGIEVFGDSSPFLDADVIMNAYNILHKALKINGVKLKINTIGDFESRSNYSKKLKDYFSDKLESLCDDCKSRIEKNPLRILDCKVDSDNPILLNAPKIKECLNESSINNFKKVLEVLDVFKINYEVDESLVRGLDYYTDTVFEFILDCDSELKGLAICGGGKYADLLKGFGGPDIPGIGFAFGVERIITIMDSQNLFADIDNSTDVVIISLDEESRIYGMKLAENLRDQKLIVQMDLKNYSLKQQFKLSDKLQAKYIIIIGEDERKSGIITIKNTNNQKQEKIEVEKIIDFIRGE